MNQPAAVFHRRTHLYGQAIDHAGRDVLVVWNGGHTATKVPPHDLLYLEHRTAISRRRWADHPGQHDIYACLTYLADIEDHAPTIDELHDELQQRGFPSVGYHVIHSAMRRLMNHGWAYRFRDDDDLWRHYPIRKPKVQP